MWSDSRLYASGPKSGFSEQNVAIGGSDITQCDNNFYLVLFLILQIIVKEALFLIVECFSDK